MDRKARIIIAITSVVLVVAIVVSFCLWRQNALKDEGSGKSDTSQTTQQPTDKKTDADAAASDTPTDEDIQVAIRFEHAMRDWGTDSLIDPDTLARRDVDDVLAQLKGSIPDGNPLRDLTTVDLNEEYYGPDGEAPACYEDTELANAVACAATPKARDWWAYEAYGYGSRWKSGPEATIDGKDIIVSGTVRAILVQDDDSFSSGEYYAITPAWRDYEVRDRLAVKDGKVTSFTHELPDYWWIDPFTTSWSLSMAGSLAVGERVVIPVKGKPDMHLSHMGTVEVLHGPVTQADLDGEADWHLWDGLIQVGITTEQGDAMMQECMEKYVDDCPLLP